MKFDPRYGPQFDPSDGTIGKLQLVGRWCLCLNDSVWPANQGRHTYATKELAEESKALYQKMNCPERFPELAKLTVDPVWCYPGHFDVKGSRPV